MVPPPPRPLFDPSMDCDRLVSIELPLVMAVLDVLEPSSVSSDLQLYLRRHLRSSARVGFQAVVKASKRDAFVAFDGKRIAGATILSVPRNRMFWMLLMSSRKYYSRN
jgi:hypothetical protein